MRALQLLPRFLLWKNALWSKVTITLHLRNTKNTFNCENIKMVWNFVVLSTFEIFIFNPNQKREKINKDRKKNYAKFSKSYKVHVIFILGLYLFLFFKFWRGLGGLFLLFLVYIFVIPLLLTRSKGGELYPSPPSSHGPCPFGHSVTPSHLSPVPWEPFSFTKLPVSQSSLKEWLGGMVDMNSHHSDISQWHHWVNSTQREWFSLSLAPLHTAKVSTGDSLTCAVGTKLFDFSHVFTLPSTSSVKLSIVGLGEKN